MNLLLKVYFRVYWILHISLDYIIFGFCLVESESIEITTFSKLKIIIEPYYFGVSTYKEADLLWRFKLGYDTADFTCVTS